jgi:hypothetical protein
MDSDEDEVMVAVRSCPLEESEDEVVVAPAHPSASSRDAPTPRGRRWEYKTTGTFLTWLVVDAGQPSPAWLPCDTPPAWLESGLDPPHNALCIGVGLCSWSLVASSPEAIERHTKVQVGVRGAVAFVQYEVLEVFALDVPIMIDISTLFTQTCLTLSRSCKDLRLGDRGVVKTNMTKFEKATLLDLPVGVASALLRGQLSVVRSVALGSSLRYKGVIDNFPKRFEIRHFWHEARESTLDERAPQPQAPAAPIRVVHHFLQKPGKRRAFPTDEKLKKPRKDVKYDPIKLIRSLAYQKFLKDEVTFTPSLAAGRRVDQDPSDEEAIPRDASNDASRTTRQRARHRFDVTLMLLERREFHEWVAAGVIESIHVFSDGSPVTGKELQGQITDIMLKSGALYRRVLPGAEVFYSLTNATQKGITLLWGLFLVRGPRKETVAEALSLIRSITTDNGTEINLIRLPQLLDAFYEWMAGRGLLEVSGSVDRTRRLMPNAIRLIGVGHTVGGMIYTLCSSDRHWPEINDHLRALVHFFRNKSYREHLEFVLRGKCNTTCLKTFEASFAKWRYETLATVIEELLPYRDICENRIAKEMFPDVQDRKAMDKALTACKIPWLWRWIAGPGVQVVVRANGFRKWAMVCGHAECQQLRHEHSKPLNCIMNSRRLPEVWDWVTKEAVKLREAANALTPAACGGDDQLCVDTKEKYEHIPHCY